MKTRLMNKRYCIVIVSLFFITGCSGTMPKLGIIDNQLTPCPDKPNCVCSLAKDKSHFIEPLHFNGAIDEAHNRILLILKDWDRVKIVTDSEDYIRAEFTSKIFRFVDDVEFHLQASQDDKIVIDVRSASRIGKSDLGANRKRIELLRSKFEVKQ